MEAKKGSIKSLADIPLDTDGFPIAGLVVWYYRKRKGWTQVQLASKLGITELMVRNMETKNQGLDSIGRRRLLCELLSIPPIALGLGSVEQLQQLFSQTEQQEKTVPTFVHRDDASNLDIYRNILTEYNQTNTKLSGASLISDTEAIIPILHEQIRDTSNKREKQELLRILWEVHRLAAKLHSDYKRNISATIKHLDSMIVISSELHDDNLSAVTHEHVTYIRLLDHSPHVARVNIDVALAHLKNASAIVQCDVYALAARIYHSSTLDLEDSSKARYFLEQSAEILRNGVPQDDRQIPMGLDVIRCQLTHIDSLIQMKRANGALDIIEDIEQATPRGYKRREAHLLIDRTSCFLQLDYPEYAIEQLSQGYTLSKSVGDMGKVAQIRDMFQNIRTGPYANNRAVLDFEEQLLKL